MESLNYTFNIHNQLTGINRDYALKTVGLYNKTGHYFGLDIGYDKTDNVFSGTQLNGQVAGLAWNTMGDDAQRKFDYTYDPAGRLINALFKQQQHPGDGFSNSTMDFSISGYGGQITYDNNGNLQAMQHKGVMPGQSAPLVIDDLRYTYNSFSNKLQSVTDQMTTTTLNGQFGDFKDGANAAGTPDYVYDANGNVIVDLNKNAQSLNNGAAGTPGIHYNYLDKPDQIRIVGKGTIMVVYSADGEKLQRVFIPESAGTSTITTYINQYIYQETSTTLTTSSIAPFSGTAPHLAYMNFEEGRLRAMTPVSTANLVENGSMVLPAAPSGGYTSGAWDYFVTDYQQNVRMILTEEIHAATNTCTMETAAAATEDAVFGQTGSGNEVELTRITKPMAWTGNGSNSVSHVGNLSGHTLGPNTLQKVMAGDKLTLGVSYYYAASATGSNPNIITNLLASLSSVITNGSASAGELTRGATSNISSQLNATPGFVNAVEPNNNTTGTPQAYLTVLFFDERFNFIAASDGGVVQQQVRSADAGNANASPLSFPAIAPKNGYAYVYVSNRSDQDVFFDQLSVVVTAGAIIEENHYYAFGLKIAAISTKKLGDVNEGNLQNNYFYQGSFSEMDADISWDGFALRNYDPQIGRWVQQDPYQESASPYIGMANDPVKTVDPSGGCVYCEVAGASQTLAQVVVRAVLPTANKVVGIGKLVKIATLTGKVLNIAKIATDIINTPLTSLQVGDPVIARSANRMGGQDSKINDRTPSAIGAEEMAAETRDNDDILLGQMRGLLYKGTAESPTMMNIAMNMFDRFRSKQGGEFSDPELNNQIAESDGYHTFLAYFEKRFEEEITASNGDIAKILKNPILIKQNDAPSFNGELNGEGILFHGINYTRVAITKFTKAGDFYAATIQIDMYDTFGLDDRDIFRTREQLGFWKGQVSGVNAGFDAWWLLQHTRGYQPFTTHLQFFTDIMGSFK